MTAATPIKFLPFTNEQLQDLEARFGRIDVVTPLAPKPRRWVPDDRPEPAWQAVFRAPTDFEASDFEKKAHSDRQDVKANAMRELARACVVAISLDGKHTILENPKDTDATRAVRHFWESDLRGRHPQAHNAAQYKIRKLMSAVEEEEGEG